MAAGAADTGLTRPLRGPVSRVVAFEVSRVHRTTRPALAAARGNRRTRQSPGEEREHANDGAQALTIPRHPLPDTRSESPVKRYFRRESLRIDRGDSASLAGIWTEGRTRRRSVILPILTTVTRIDTQRETAL